MKANRKFSKDEEAVSPVIGVILMVAITVILAAVIAAFVFGMGSSLSKQYVVACTVSQISSTQIDVTYAGGPDADAVDYFDVIITSSTGDIYNAKVGNTSGGSADVPVGTSISIPGVSAASPPVVILMDPSATTMQADDHFAERDHVVITSTFLDGTKQVILDTYV